MVRSIVRSIDKRMSIQLICILFLISTLSGCMKSPSLGHPGGQAPAMISVWYSLQGKQEQQLLQEFQRISQGRPEVLIKAEFIPEEKFADLVWKYQAGGEGPEVVIANREIIHALYEQGALSPLNSALQEVFPSAISTFTFNKTIYAAPWLTDVPLLYYRTDIEDVRPSHLNEIWEEKTPIGMPSLDLGLLSPWWKSEGGILSLAGVPALNAPTNIAFLDKVQTLRRDGLLVVDPLAKERFVSGELQYYLSWASEGRILDQSGVNCISLYTLLGANAKPFLDQTIAIANSSIKNTPEIESAIEIVETELLRLETQTAMVKAGSILPANSTYYQGSAPLTVYAETNITLNNALSSQGNLNEWKLFNLLNEMISTLGADRQIETELEQIQKKALELVEKT